MGHRFRVSRDTTLFVFGMVGITHEALMAGPERPVLLAVFAACCGLPVFLRLDERRADP